MTNADLQRLNNMMRHLEARITREELGEVISVPPVYIEKMLRGEAVDGCVPFRLGCVFAVSGRCKQQGGRKEWLQEIRRELIRVLPSAENPPPDLGDE